MVAIAADAAWRQRIAAAAGAAGTTVIAPPSGVLSCAPGTLSLLVPLLEADPVSARPRIPTVGACTDSIADRELRDAVADVAALLSLHGTVILDLDAGRSRWRRTPRPDIVVSSGHHGPQWTDMVVSIPVGVDSGGAPMTALLTASSGFEHILLELARIVELDQRPARAA